MLPLEKNRFRLDDDSDEDKVCFSSLCTTCVDQGLIWCGEKTGINKKFSYIFA